MRFPHFRLTAPKAPAFLTSLVWFVAVALCAWILAGWYWRFKAPAAIAAAPPEVTDPLAAAKLVSARHLFGEPQTSGPMPVVTSRHTLLGVATGNLQTRGFAVIAEDGRPAEGFVEGEELAPGVRLISIHHSSVEIERNGQRETIRLTEKVRGSSVAAPSTPAFAPNTIHPGMTPNQPLDSQGRLNRSNQPGSAAQPQIMPTPAPQMPLPQQQAASQDNTQSSQ